MGNENSKKIENNVVIKWKKAEVKCPFLPREGQAAAVIGTKLYLFGGVVFAVSDDECKDAESDELLVYDIHSQSWSKEVCSGSCPGKRSGATMTSVGNRLFLFGGLSQLSGWMNDFHVYDTDNKVWQQLDLPNAPSCRDKVMSASVEDKIYIFGGFGPIEESIVHPDDILPIEDEDDDDEYEDMDEMHEIRNCQEAANFSWSDQLYEYDTSKEKWSLVVCSKKAPTPRAAHSLTYVKDSTGKEWLYVFGGRDIDARQNDLWRFNITEKVWEECKGLGFQPQPRSFHASASVEDRLVIFGGRSSANQHFSDFNIYDIKTNQWLQPKLFDPNDGSGDSSVSPPAMGLHSMCLVKDSLVLFGGSSDLDPATGTCTKFYNDIYILQASDILKGGSIKSESTDNNINENGAGVPEMLNLKPAAPTKTED